MLPLMLPGMLLGLCHWLSMMPGLMPGLTPDTVPKNRGSLPKSGCGRGYLAPQYRLPMDVLHGQMPAFAQAKKADAGISTPQRLLRLSQPSILRPICKAATLPSKVTYKLTWKVAIEAPGTGIATVTGNESVLSASACSVLAIVTAAEVFICAFGLAHGSNSKVDTTLGAVEKTVSAKACVHTSLNPRVLSSQVQNVGFFVPKTSQNPVDVAEEAEARKARKARTKNGG